MLPRFSQLTSLEVAADNGLSPVLPRLAALQRLKRGSGGYSAQFMQALRPLSNLTHLVGCALIVLLGGLQACCQQLLAGSLLAAGACHWSCPTALNFRLLVCYRL